MNTSDHADNLQAEDEQNPRILESSLPPTSFVLLDHITQRRSEPSSGGESILPTSSSVLIPEAQDEQNPKTLESCLPTTLSVLTEITEARNEPSSGVESSSLISSSVLTDTTAVEGEQSVTVEPSLPTRHQRFHRPTQS
jgi:hypothetical protein